MAFTLGVVSYKYSMVPCFINYGFRLVLCVFGHTYNLTYENWVPTVYVLWRVGSFSREIRFREGFDLREPNIHFIRHLFDL